MPAGEVTNIDLELDKAGTNVRPRVTISFHPERRLAYADPAQKERMSQILTGNDQHRNTLLQKLIEDRGLRAQLRSGSLITGQMYVAFEYFAKPDRAKVDWSRAEPDLPVIPSSLVGIEEKLTSVLNKIDKLPLEEAGTSLKSDLQALEQVLNGANKLISHVDTELVPTLKTDLDSMQHALTSIERGMSHADATLLGPGAPAQQELHDALIEFTRAASSMRMLIDYLERHPESAIRGKTPSNSGDK
jgi:paraquat-inducible protein B